MAYIVSCIYPNLLDNFLDIHYFEEYIINLISGEEKHYFSSDWICKSDTNVGIDIKWITVEFSNQIKCAGLPNHGLKLKKGVFVILLWNIDQAVGLCNGTQLIRQEKVSWNAKIVILTSL